MKNMPELCSHDPLAPISFDCIPDKRFRGVVAVTFSGVDQINAEVAGLVENTIDCWLSEADTPLSAVLPGANANNRYAKIGFSEGAVVHGF